MSKRRSTRSIEVILFGLFLFAIPSMQVIAASSNAVSRALALPKSGLMVVERGQAVIAHNADRPMVPASTMKVLTTLASIQRWGLDHRFHTDFYLDSNDVLWAKGYGDPYLVSEELDLISRALKQKGIRSVAGIGTDDGYFAPRIQISGRSSSNNPYDAPVTALAANFNTVNLHRKAGATTSSEPQTPLTPTARQFGNGLPSGKHRINLKERPVAVRYFGELFAAKLSAAGIQVGDQQLNGKVPMGAKQIYRHRNSRNLRAVLTPMLEYSNNFIANGLFLLLGDLGNGRALDMKGAQQAADVWARKNFRWRDYRIEDGAGLSRGNRLSARQLVDVLKAFAPYRDLLPAQNAQIKAKTGTLRGVSCYAGFVDRGGRWEPFSLLINQPVDYHFRRRVADDLVRTPNLAKLCKGGAC